MDELNRILINAGLEFKKTAMLNENSTWGSAAAVGGMNSERKIKELKRKKRPETIVKHILDHDEQENDKEETLEEQYNAYKMRMCK